VTLTGTAPDAGSQARAKSLAAGVSGVRSVDNQLQVARNG
jgi:osmotically-inducible protein OsmY